MRFILFFLILFTASFAFTTDAYASSSSLKCTPTTGTYQVGDTFTVDYVLDTRSSPTFGADAVATYDTSILEATTAQSALITTSTNWSQPITNTVDAILGKIILEYGNSQPTFTGSGSIGRISFRAKAPGQAQFNYTFFQQYDDTTPGVAKVWGKRDGVNITNVLTDVNNCIYVVEGSISATPVLQPSPTLAAGIPTYTPVPQPTVMVLPHAGSVETTAFFLGLTGLLLTIGTTAAVVLKRD